MIFTLTLNSNMFFLFCLSNQLFIQLFISLRSSNFSILHSVPIGVVTAAPVTSSSFVNPIIFAVQNYYRIAVFVVVMMMLPILPLVVVKRVMVRRIVVTRTLREQLMFLLWWQMMMLVMLMLVVVVA